MEDREERATGVSALIDIGHPDLERHRADLEHIPATTNRAPTRTSRLSEFKNKVAQGVKVERVLARHRQLGIAGHAIQEDDAKQQDGGTHRAENQILQTGLQRKRRGASIRDQYVERHRDRFQRDKQHHEVVTLHQQHHAGRYQHDQVVEFGARQRRARQVDAAEVTDKYRAEQEEGAHDLRQPGLLDHATEQDRIVTGSAETRHANDQRQNQQLPVNRNPPDHRTAAFGQDHLGGEQSERQQRQQDLGQDRQPLIGRGITAQEFSKQLVH